MLSSLSRRLLHFNQTRYLPLSYIGSSHRISHPNLSFFSFPNFPRFFQSSISPDTDFKFRSGEHLFQTDPKQAIEIWKECAENGHAEAQNRLGDCYARGQGVELDYKEAARLWSLAADQGIATAQHRLGRLYYYGKGVTQNIQKAYALWQAAADQNLAAAQYELGLAHLQTSPPDYKKAIAWFQHAAEKNLALAQASLGFAYQQGIGVEQNVKEAVRLYQLAANQNHIIGQRKLAILYLLGEGGIQKDVKEAIRLLQKVNESKKQRPREGKTDLAQKDEDVIRRLLRVASNEGSPDASHYLGLLYMEGKEFEKNEEEGKRFLSLAETQGYVPAKST